METTTLMENVINIRDSLKKFSDSEDNPIYMKLDPIKPFIGCGEIKLIIIGQDPTIQNFEQRMKINMTLNLDKKGGLKNYIKMICKQLNITMDNIYATNLFKYFYTCPPANTLHVLKKHLKNNLVLLIEELSLFADIPIVALGEPVLELLSKEFKDMKYYWDYQEDENNHSGFNYRCCPEKNSKLNRAFFPIIHQPSMSKGFYKFNFDGYMMYLKSIIEGE